MIKKIVLTGAGGRLGSYIREPISKICESLVSSDIKEDIGKLYKNEQYVKADISIYDEIEPIIKDATIVCHFGAIVDEFPFNELLGQILLVPIMFGRLQKTWSKKSNLCKFYSCCWNELQGLLHLNLILSHK